MSLMYAQMGMSVVNTAFGLASSRIDRDMQAMQRDYQNTMQAISAAQQLNTLSQNEIGVRDAAVRASQSIEIQSLQDRAQTEVGAAAAGVTGGSVTSAMHGLSRSRLNAKQALHQRLETQAQSDIQQRRNVAFSKVYGKDISVIPQPSAASALLGLGASIIDVYDSHQPEGSRIEDTIAGWGRT